MQKIFSMLSIFFMMIIAIPAYATSLADDTPIGFWKTIDDTTGKPKAIVQIWQASDKNLYGKVLKVFRHEETQQSEFCTACQGEKHNQRIIGLVILEKLKQNKDNKKLWGDGKILDPKNGKTYHSNLQLADNGDKLNVRGYIGVPLFGRTQTWLRVNKPA